MLSASSSSMAVPNGKVKAMDPSSQRSHQESSNNKDIKKVFEAAVNVIRNLPPDAKDAPFTPSDELKLKFYAYYKQATEGPNKTPKPAFYDVVGKYKWSAWTNLGNMSKEDAMNGYINELKQIVETMSLTQPVADFYEVLGPFYEFVFPDKEKKVSSKTSARNGSATFAGSSTGNHNGGLYLSSSVDNESEGEEFSDTYDHITESHSQATSTPQMLSVTDGDEIISARGESELTPPRFGHLSQVSRLRGGSSSGQTSIARSSGQGYGSSASSGSSGAAGGDEGPGNSAQRPVSLPEVNEQIAVAILRLQHSMEQVCYRLDSIENRIERANPSVIDNKTNNSQRRGNKSSWWPLENMSPTTTVFLLAWPFITHFLIEKVRDRQRK